MNTMLDQQETFFKEEDLQDLHQNAKTDAIAEVCCAAVWYFFLF